jgi:hypothetical protein
MENGKWKPKQFSLIHFPFSHSANESLSFVRLFAKKQTEVTCLQNGPNGLAHLCQYVKGTVSREFLIGFLVLKAKSVLF